MRKQTWQPFWFTLCLGILAAHLAAAENLIKNESLEDANQDYPTVPLGFGTHIRQGANDVDPRYQWVEGGRSFKMGFKSVSSGEIVTVRPSLNVPAQEPNTLYRYSVWYRTAGANAESKAIQINPPGFPYPTAPAWTQAYVFFMGTKQPPNLDIYIMSYRGGNPAYQKDASDQVVKDAQGRSIVTNAMALTAELDDFELCSVALGDLKGNLAPNGGFELGSTNAIAPGWRHMFGAGCSVIDGTTAHTGQHSLRTDRRDLSAGTDALYPVDLPFKAGGFYTISCWLKSDVAGIPVEFRLCVPWSDSKRQGEVLWDKSDLIGTAWKHYEYYVEIPDKNEADYLGAVALLSLRIDYGRKGLGKPCRIWLDDVSVVEETW